MNTGSGPADWAVPAQAAVSAHLVLVWGSCVVPEKKGGVVGAGQSREEIKGKGSQREGTLSVPVQSLCTWKVIPSWQAKG